MSERERTTEKVETVFYPAGKTLAEAVEQGADFVVLVPGEEANQVSESEPIPTLEGMLDK